MSYFDLDLSTPLAREIHNQQLDLDLVTMRINRLDRSYLADLGFQKMEAARRLSQWEARRRYRLKQLRAQAAPIAERLRELKARAAAGAAIPVAPPWENEI